MKRILLISYNFNPELTGIGKYNGEMMEWFARKGYDCSVITGYPYYPDWKVQGPYRKKRFWFSTETPAIADCQGTLTIYRCPLYIPAVPSGAKRMLLDASFLISAFLRTISLLFCKTYDYVVVVSPPFHLGLLGLLYKYIKSAKLIYHIQDIQIEAARDLKLIRWKFAINMMLYVERQILRRADLASTISSGMMQKVRMKRGDTTLLFPNWTDTLGLFPMKSSFRQKFGFSDDDIVVLYSGAIGEKQGLESLLMAAYSNRANHRLKFVICGNGPYKGKLQDLASQLGVANVVFLPLQPHKVFNQFLNTADIHVVLQKASAADLVMPSKLAAILAVGGLAIITAERGTSLYSLVREHRMGFLIHPEDQDALNDAIAELAGGHYEDMRTNARKYAEEYLCRDRVMNEFEKALLDLLPRRAMKEQIQIRELVDEVRS